MANPAAPSVTVIDDDPHQLAFLVAAIRRGGFGVTGFRRALDGLAYVIEQRPSALVLDLCMPEMDGIETLKRLQIGAPELPVLVVTGLISPRSDSHLDKLRRSGAVDCLLKPIDGPALCARLRDIIAAAAGKPGYTDQESARSGANATPAAWEMPTR